MRRTGSWTSPIGRMEKEHNSKTRNGRLELRNKKHVDLNPDGCLKFVPRERKLNERRPEHLIPRVDDYAGQQKISPSARAAGGRAPPPPWPQLPLPVRARAGLELPLLHSGVRGRCIAHPPLSGTAKASFCNGGASSAGYTRAARTLAGITVAPVRHGTGRVHSREGAGIASTGMAVASARHGNGKVCSREGAGIFWGWDARRYYLFYFTYCFFSLFKDLRRNWGKLSSPPRRSCQPTQPDGMKGGAPALGLDAALAWGPLSGGYWGGDPNACVAEILASGDWLSGRVKQKRVGGGKR